jgi:hypothetical protein
VKAAVIATQQAGQAFEKAAHDVGNTLQKAGQDVGHGAAEVGKFVEKHPWETVIAVALIAGGGYLIVYEGYTLAVTVEGVQVVTITSGATSGVVVGTAAAAAGGGLVVDKATKNSSADFETTIVRSPPATPTTATAQTPEPARVSTNISPSNAPKNVPEEKTGRNEESLVFAPYLSPKPTDVDRLGFALWVSDWAEKVEPISAFDPAKSPQITPAELKLLEAITELTAIGPSEGDELAVELHDEIHNPVSSEAKDQVKDLAKSLGWRILTRQPIGDLFTWGSRLEALTSIPAAILSGITPSATTELMDRSRDELLQKLEQQLTAYERKRDPQMRLMAPAVPVDPKNGSTAGPTLEAAPH